MCVKKVKLLRLVKLVSQCLTMGHRGDSYCSPEMDRLGEQRRNMNTALFQSSTVVLEEQQYCYYQIVSKLFKGFYIVL